MMFFHKCRFDFDSNRIEAILSDGSHLSIDCIAVENELAETWLDRRELDLLIYNYRSPMRNSSSPVAWRNI